LKNGWVINFNENQEIVHKELYKNGELLIGDVRVKYLETCKSKGIDPND
jgi:antitoxin component YwqK of YwqJK toxin-antitoxin module